MLARVHTLTLQGLIPLSIEVEVDGGRGVPGFSIIGLPSKAVDEARERVTAALTNCGIKIRSKKTIVNLAPADLQKHGSSFDVSIAMGILKMYGEVKQNTDTTLFFGELSLDGSIKPIRGALTLALAAKKLGFETAIFPYQNAAELSVISDTKIGLIHHLNELLHWANGGELTWLRPTPFTSITNPSATADPFSHIVGQHSTKRALIISAAGGHHVLMTGPPGSGKSELAQCLPRLLPPLTEIEALEVTQLYSVVGQTQSLISERPFRQPHHSISMVSLIGGGPHLKPGEISLAHRGVLFLDELPEFNRACLENLRQPLENHHVTLNRVQGSVSYPANFRLIASANPCPCGFFGSESKNCSCSPGAQQHYRHRISGPLKDRFDVHVWVREVPGKELTNIDAGRSAEPWREKILSAVQLQRHRWQSHGFSLNAEATLVDLKKASELLPASWNLIYTAYDRYQLSMRGLVKLARISRTIADLAQETQVTPQHVSEALHFRGEES